MKPKTMEAPEYTGAFFTPPAEKKEIKIAWNLTNLILTPGLWRE
jgi:hypothetical protein